MPVALYFSHGVGSRGFLDLAEGAAEGAAFPAGKVLVPNQIPAGDPQRAPVVSYAERYRNRFQQEPNTFGGHASDALSLVIRALREAGPGRREIREFLEAVDEYPGVSGVFRYSRSDHAGLGSESLVMVRIRGDAWVLEP